MIQKGNINNLSRIKYFWLKAIIKIVSLNKKRPVGIWGEPDADPHPDPDPDRDWFLFPGP